MEIRSEGQPRLSEYTGVMPGVTGGGWRPHLDIPTGGGATLRSPIDPGLRWADLPVAHAPRAKPVAERSHRARAATRAGLVVAVWASAIALASIVHPIGWVHDGALFGHLMALAVGFGAVVVLDFYGTACLTGKRSPVTVARLAVAVDPLIWGGFFVLVISGSLLAPHLSDPFTRIKLAAVLIAGLNGVNADGLRDAIRALPSDASLRQLPRRLLVRLAVTAMVSQAAWWSAILVGFWNNPHG